MSDTVIRVENLSKKYVLNHQQESRGSYKALRDVIADGAKSIGKSVLRPSGKVALNPAREEFWALKDVSFDIKQGDRVGIIGRNGAGKSTLLKILSRIVEPSRGTIRIKGRVASLLEVGTGFHPELTGRENIYLNGAILGMSREEIKRKFDEIVAFAEVEKFLDTPVKRYSSGMYVRLAFAVAAHLEPEVLIVDEVLAVGDAQFQKKCLNRMDEVAGEGRTVLFVSHNMGAVSSLCTQAIYLAQGQIQEIGSTEKVVASFMSKLFDNSITDLAALRSPGFGKSIRFTEISLKSNEEAVVPFSHEIECSLTLFSKANLRNLSIGASIFSLEGHCIGNLITKDNFSINANQEITLNLQVPNFNLAPGSYYCGFSVGQGGLESTNRVDLDIVTGKPTFQITPLAEEENNIIANWQAGWGNIVIEHSRLSITNPAKPLSV